MLEKSVKRRITDRSQQMSADGELLSKSQLDQFYSTFRSRFGPDKLANLDGEALLESMHSIGNRDSLVYWLEFKNDDEFPARFGSIAGGSALKFGIFRRKETNEWETSDKKISVQEAVVIARKHRDQLLLGVDALHQLPPSGSDDNYKALQERLDRDAPDVSALAWGHKYFSLLFPDKLDDYHNPDLRRFQLLKMLQRPPEGRGRYMCAGRFVAAATELGFPMNNLTTVLNAVNGRKHRYWRIETSDGTTPRNRWETMRNENCVAIGWPGLGDLTLIEANKEGREKLYGIIEQKYFTDASLDAGRKRNQVFNFVTAIAEGDLVLPSDGSAVLGVGRVTGDYVYNSGSDFPHRRPVEWLLLDEWKMPQEEGLQSIVHEIKQQHVDNVLEVERKVQNAPKPVHAVVSVAVTSGAGGMSYQPPRLSGIPGRVQSVLERKSQVILYGPPGTGKTYWAEKVALELSAYWCFGKPFDQLTPEERVVVAGNQQGGGFVRICCFHPAYGYEDFIEGYRPETTVNGQVTFCLRDGVFKRLCKEAEQTPDRKFFMLVDEINRGDIPRIFGELLTILEKDKRGKSLLLPVSGDSFRVPPNIFLIGTMNTADRSISLLDAALRRRFGFVELMPDSSTLRDHSVSGVPLGPWLEALNRRVCEHVGRDARNLQIGHSYLLQGGRPVKDMAAFRRALQDDIVPLLEEYCYEEFATLHSILGNGLVDLEKRRIRQELFEDEREADLVQALLEPCPEILTSTEALASQGQAEEPQGEEDGDNEGDSQ